MIQDSSALPTKNLDTPLISPCSVTLILALSNHRAMQCAECRREFSDVTKAEDSRLYLCGACHEKERVHWMILLSTHVEEQAFLARILRVIERADQSRPRDYGRPVIKEDLRKPIQTWNGLVPIA